MMVSLLGVNGYFIASGQFGDVKAAFDRDTLLLPDRLIDDLSTDAHVLLTPVFDAQGQASGWKRCLDT